MSEPLPTSNDIQFALALGRVEGQLKELIHNMGSKDQRDEALGRTLAELKSIPDDVSDIKKSVASLDERVAQLELRNAATSAEKNLMMAILKSPSVPWILGFLTLVWAAATGKLTI